MNQKTTAKIDFKKYRTPELFETVSELIDWRGTMGRGFYQAALGTFLMSISAIRASWFFVKLIIQSVSG